MSEHRELKADVIVVGTGPGGASVARELAAAGHSVLILERGREHRHRFYYGTYLGALIYSDRFSLLFTKEGLNIVRPLMVGGATSMFCGCASPPPDWLRDKYQLDISDEVEQTVTELGVEPLPEALCGTASTQIAQAARALGYDWFVQPKFMKPSDRGLDCGAKCMLGCRCGGKWNAGEYVDQAVRFGASLQTRARVTRVLSEDGQVTGVAGRLRGRPFVARANTVVLAAGGIGTPRILQRSGQSGAGQGMTMDTTVMVYGFSKTRGNGQEPPMTYSWENDRDGYMLSTLIDPWLLYPMIAARVSLRYLFTWPKWNRIFGLMIKLKDEVSGGVLPNGTISKPLTDQDRERLMAARSVCEQILVEAGAERSSIFMTPLRGTHPSGTVRLGEMVDTDLQTQTRGLFVCDASVFPEALDRPTVLTIIGMGKRLAKHLTQPN